MNTVQIHLKCGYSVCQICSKKFNHEFSGLTSTIEKLIKYGQNIHKLNLLYRIIQPIYISVYLDILKCTTSKLWFNEARFNKSHNLGNKGHTHMVCMCNLVNFLFPKLLKIFLSSPEWVLSDSTMEYAEIKNVPVFVYCI